MCVTHSVYLVKGLPLFVGHSQALSSLDAATHLIGPHLQIRQVLLFNKRRQRPRKLQREMGKSKRPESVCVCVFMCQLSVRVCVYECVSTLVPFSPLATALSLPPGAPAGCACSLHGDTGRWLWAGRGCSSGSRRSYSGRGPGSGSPGTFCLHLSP